MPKSLNIKTHKTILLLFHMDVKLGFLLEENIVDWEECANGNAETSKKLSITENT
jgi:hypothetical protein